LLLSLCFDVFFLLLVQMGNAVAPPVAAALGRCFALAAQKKSPVAEPVISVPDPEYEAMLVEARAKGLKFYSEEHRIDDVSNNWAGKARVRCVSCQITIQIRL
jgi:hypothetical protein